LPVLSKFLYTETVAYFLVKTTVVYCSHNTSQWQLTGTHSGTVSENRYFFNIQFCYYL